MHHLKDSRLRVVKKLSPLQPGAVKLARQYGDALLCVRHRHDSEGSYRYTTVELVVDRAPIQHRPGRMVGVRLALNERTLRLIACASGATWDPTTKLWRMPRQIAQRLGLLDRVEVSYPAMDSR